MKHDRLHWHYARGVPEFLLHGRRQRFMDARWITPSLVADFVEKGRPEHHSSRERDDVRNGLMERQNLDLDIIEAHPLPDGWNRLVRASREARPINRIELNRCRGKSSDGMA